MNVLRILVLVAISALCAFHSTSIQAATTSIDRYTYDTRQVITAFGKVGIGISWKLIRQVGGAGLSVTDVKNDSPAQKAGLRVDDEIHAINDQLLIGMDEEQAVMALRLDSLTQKKLWVKRDGSYQDIVVDTNGAPLGITTFNTDPGFYARIDKVIDGLPAQKAGLLAGDLLLGIDFKILADFAGDSEIERYFATGDIGSKIKLMISRKRQVYPVTVERGIIPNVDAQYGVQTVIRAKQMSPFAIREWVDLSLWNLDWSDLLNANFKQTSSQKGNVLDDALARIANEDYVVWNLKGNLWGNNPHQVARIIARFMKEDGNVMSFYDAASDTQNSYTLNDGVLTRTAVGGYNGTVEVERGIKRFKPKLAILVNRETSAGAVAIAFALKMSNSATIFGQTPFGSVSIKSFKNPAEDIFEVVDTGFYTMVGKIQVGANVDQEIDALSNMNSSRVASLLIGKDLQWWEDDARLGTVTQIGIGGIITFIVACAVMVFAPRSMSGFASSGARRAAFVIVVSVAIAAGVMAFIAMLSNFFWFTVIACALTAGILIGRGSIGSSNNKSTSGIAPF